MSEQTQTLDELTSEQKQMMVNELVNRYELLKKELWLLNVNQQTYQTLLEDTAEQCNTLVAELRKETEGKSEDE